MTFERATAGREGKIQSDSLQQDITSAVGTTTRRLNWLKLFSGAVGMGSWGLSGWYLRVPPIPLGGWGTGNTPHLPPKCPWQNFPQQPRKPGHQTAGGGRGPGVRAAPPPAPRAVHWHPGRPPSGWFGRGAAYGPPAPVAASL